MPSPSSAEMTLAVLSSATIFVTGGRRRQKLGTTRRCGRGTPAPRDAMQSPCPSPQVASVGDVVTVTGLQPALEYHYCLQAVNAVGVGHWSVAKSFSTLSSSPSQVGVFKVVRQTTNSITLTWATPLDNGDPISYYHIECGSRTISVEGAQTEVTVADLTPDTTYRSVCPWQCLLLSVH